MPLSDQVPDFSGLRVAVVGDLIADHYLYGRPSRLSREAPVMILRHVGEDIGAGGAANVARNLWALGARARVIGAVGDDETGRKLVAVLKASDLRTDEILTVDGRITPTKTRVLGAEPRRTMQQMLRIDREPDGEFDATTKHAISDRVRSVIGEIDALVVSDYGYGTASDELAEIAREASQAGVTVVLDPRESLSYFRGITAITPNLSELARATGHGTDDFDDWATLGKAARSLVEANDLKCLMVTMGNRGMSLFGRELPENGIHVASSGSDEVIDVSGAGDTAAATFSLALAAGMDGSSAMRMANAAAGVVVMESGTAVCTASKLRSALPKSPVPGAPE
jgi:rfaE bifunctional protein kinase chain/domain